MSGETDWGTPELNALWRDHQEKEAAASELLDASTAARLAYERADAAWVRARRESNDSYQKWASAKLADEQARRGRP